MPKRATKIILSEQEQEGLLQITTCHRSEQQVVLQTACIGVHGTENCAKGTTDAPAPSGRASHSRLIIEGSISLASVCRG